MQYRRQRTLAHPVEVSGFGFFTGSDVRVRLLPAPPETGLRFRRTDLPGRPEIPATIDFLTPRPRRTALARGPATVEMTEHLLAALAGLHVDNCIIELDAVEVPGGDGSSQLFVEPLLEVGTIEQDAWRPVLAVRETIELTDESGAYVRAEPLERGQLLRYELDYGTGPIGRQDCQVAVTPRDFVVSIAFARTFVMEYEVEALRQQGFGQRVTAQDLLVFGPEGPVDNTLRAENECARHKLLDCIGDFALAGCDLVGQFTAHASGHRLNHRFIEALLETHAASRPADLDLPRHPQVACFPEKIGTAGQSGSTGSTDSADLNSQAGATWSQRSRKAA